MICLKHQQQYNEGEYCIYCGCSEQAKSGNANKLSSGYSDDDIKLITKHTNKDKFIIPKTLAGKINEIEYMYLYSPYYKATHHELIEKLILMLTSENEED